MLKLVELGPEYREQLNDMMAEWYASDEKIVPFSIRKDDYREFDRYLKGLMDEGKPEHPEFVPGSTFFGLDVERNRFVGAVNIRHYLNEELFLHGGHIGDGVRPSERRKGYATEMIRLALEKCRGLGIDRVLITCSKTNLGSAKSIQKNGGVLENEVEIDGEVIQRYWIEL